MPLEEALDYFSARIESELGIVYSRDNYFQLENRLNEIATLLGLSGIDELHASALRAFQGQLKALLLDLATNNETSFFRDAKVFKAIEKEVISPFASGPRSAGPLRIWSAACSSGQEALSVAITALEWAARTRKPLDFEILASDISERILERARKAAYSQLEVQRGLPSPLMLKYFALRPDGAWAAAPILTQKVKHQKINLTEKFAFSDKFDLILCRNVLIYQNVERKARIVAKLCDALAPGGYLILGAAESLIGLSDQFEAVCVDGSILFKKRPPLAAATDRRST